MKRRIYRALGILILFSTTACVNQSASDRSRNDALTDGIPEAAYCQVRAEFNDSVTISGRGLYRPRQIFGEPGDGGLGEATTSYPIRYAEARALSSSGQIIQCTETDSEGRWKMTLPRGRAPIKIQINSRGNNEWVKASVLRGPETNFFYSLETTIYPARNQKLPELVARPDAEDLSGAFNILDQVVAANIKLRTWTSDCAHWDCSQFTQEQKVSIYWEKGFNPGSYFNSRPVSFYLPGKYRLFILGGEDGDADFSDTDQYDNSVIIHEYGHFLEDTWFASDSPGGAHSGNRLIDPRLAWSEGWANFFQAAVLGEAFYTDTIGNLNGETDFIFRIDLEDVPTDCGVSPFLSGCDVAENLNEGNFREFAITRALYDVFDPATGDDSVADGFIELWSVLTSNLRFLNPNVFYRSVGAVWALQATLDNATDWSTVLSAEGMTADRSEYATPTVRSSSVCSWSITPLEGGDLADTNLVVNNQFLLIEHSGGDLDIEVSYTTAAGTEADLDVYLISDDYRLTNDLSIVSAAVGAGGLLARSNDTPDEDLLTTETESIKVRSLSADTYLLWLSVLSGSANETSIQVRYNSKYLCTGSFP